MKTSILFLFWTMFSFSYSQSIYDVTPGTEGNQIILSLSNLSEITNLEEVYVKLSRQSPNLSFSKEEKRIERINVKEETDVSFLFDVKRESPVNSKDTLEFIISNSKGILTTKKFILKFTPPKEFKIEQNFPNPFNPTTTIQYQIPASLNPSKGGTPVSLRVYDMLGREVAILVNNKQESGYYEVKFNASYLSSGVYIYRLTAGDYNTMKKMMVLK